MTVHEGTTASEGALRRRSVLTGAAWSAPIIALGVAAPVAAASGTSPCVPVKFAIPLNQPSSNSVVLTHTDPLGHVYVLTISSAVTANTAVGQSRPATGTPYTSTNLSTTGSGWNGGFNPNGSEDALFTNFAPSASAGAIVLNQRTTTSPEPNGTVPDAGSDQQTLTFTFTKNGALYNPKDLTIDIFDITSLRTAPNNTPLSWRNRYRDMVGFSQQPSEITTVGPYVKGAGTGTIASPYRRSGDNSPTTGVDPILDTFVFDSFPSGSTMVYRNGVFTNSDGTASVSGKGWHFISISGIQFISEDCVPAV